MRIKKIAHMVFWSFGIILLIISFGFTIKQTRQLVCANVKVDITDSIQEKFIRSSDIRKWVQRNHHGIFGKPIRWVDLRRIENGLRKLQSIEEVDVFTNIDNNGVRNYGTLVIRIKQRDPVFRVVGSGHAFYMDKHGKTMDWSPNYTPRVIIVGGTVSANFARKKLLPLITYINKDDFLSAQIDQLYVNAIGKLSMIPRVGDQLILFGEPDNYEVKFRNLKALYTEGFKNGGWSRYKTINLEYCNQIVCTKK